MKILYNILTVLFWLLLVLSAFIFVRTVMSGPPTTDPVYKISFVAGVFIGAALIPGIVWIIRYFVGRALNRSKYSSQGKS